MHLYLFLFPVILMAAETYKGDDRIHLMAELNCGGTQYAHFYPKINKLSMLRINLSNTDLSTSDNCNIIVKSVDSGKQSYAFPLTNDSGKKNAVEFLSLILFFEKGVNNAINWDTSFDTNSCKNRRIINKTCAVEYKKDSYKFIKIFAAGVGTDKKNTPLTSGQLLPSTFVKFGVGGVIDDATKFINKAGDWFSKKF